jgi:autotransporter-associated beta strand protein
VAGSNVVNNIDALILQGGTTTIDQIVGNFGAGLEVRGWQGVDGQIDGSMFDMPGTPAHSTSAGTLGYATEAINMNGDNQEHFGADRHGGVPNASVRPPGYQDNYTVEYRGKLKIEADGIYSFATTSDDGSALWIDPGDVSTANPLYATAAVQNSYSQPMTTRNSGQISLTAGYHDFIVRFYEGGSGNGLQVQWDPTGGTTWAAIPGENYFHGSEGPGALNLPDTAVTVTDSSTLATPVGYGISKLGALTLVGGSELTLSGATSASFNGLAGTGSVVGTVIIPAGGMVSPGTDTTIGTITASGLTLDSGSFLTFNIAGTGSLDQVIVTDADGLTINGGGIFLFEAGGTTQFSTLGVAYSLIGYNTSFVGDLANLYVENKIPDTSYRFEANGSFITLTLAVAGYWNGGGTDPNWSTAANWNNIAPVTGDVLKFRAEGSAGVALNDNLDNGRSFASLQFDGGAPAFTLDGNSIKLTSDGGQRGIMVNNSANVQTVNMNVELTHNGKIDANSADIAVGGDISGGYSLTKIGGSQLTLSGDNSYTGGTIINAGNVVVGSATALGAAGGNLTMGGGSLDLGGISQTIGVLSVTAAASGGDTISNGSLTGTSYNISNTTGEAVISANLLASGSAGLAKSGAGTATLSGTNTYTGLTDITAGTLKLGSAGALAGKGDVTVNGTLDLNDNSPTIKALNGAGTITTSAGAATLTVGDGDASGTFSGKITDGMSAVTVSTYELGASGSGTRIEVVNYPDNMGNLVPWIAKGTLPSGSILRSVSANLKIDASDADSWASDFLVYVDGAPEAPGTAALLQIGGDYNGAVGTVAQTLGWNGGDDGPPNGAVIDSKTSGNWSGDIDLSTAQLSIGNNYAGATFSGTVTVAYGGTAFPVSLTKVGNGTLELRGVIAYTGGTTIEAGTLYVHAADNAYHDGLPVPMGNVTIESGATLLGNRTNFVGTLTMNGGKWNDDNGFTGSWTGPVSLGAGTTSTIQGLQSINGDISGPGGLDVESPWWTPGELHLNGTNNTFEGGVTFRGGSIVTIVSSTGLGTGTLRTAASMYGPEEGRPWRINAGTLNVGADMSSGSGIANNIDLSSGGNFTVTGSDAVLSGQISGSGTLTKAGGNTLTLSAANIHTGGTIVNAGTLTINGSLADSTMTIDTGTANGNGTLTFNIVGATCDLIKVMNGGTLDITNLHIDINATAGDLTELSYVLVNWAIEAATAGNLIGAKFAGESVPYGWKIDYNLDDSQIVLVPGQVGDTNNDGVVDAADFITLKKNFGAGVGGGFTVGNFDNTGTVDWKDLRTLMTNMGNGGSGAPATTPEPATLGLLAIGGLALLRRRRAA